MGKGAGNEGKSKAQLRGIRRKQQSKMPLGTAKNNGALIVTCVRGREKQALKEILQVLHETPTVKAWQQSMAATDVTSDDEDEDEGDSTNATAGNSDGSDIAAALAQELEELKGGGKDSAGKPVKKLKLAFRDLDVGKGVVGGGLVVLLCAYQALDPVEIVRDVFRQLCDPNSLAQVTKTCTQLIPLQKVTGSSTEELNAVVDTMVPSFFASQDPTSFAVRFKKRVPGGLKLNKMDVINHVASFGTDKHTVDLVNPEIAVAINTLQNVGGVSVVSDFKQFHEFNMHAAFRATHHANDSEAESENGDGEAAVGAQNGKQQKRKRDTNSKVDSGEAKVIKTNDTK